MPRLRTVIGEHPASRPLHGPALRARRLHDLMEGRGLEDHECYRPSGNPPRYVVIQEYADSGRGCGQWIKQGDDPTQLLRVGDDGWWPVELHDLDAEGHGWGVDAPAARVVVPGAPAVAIERVGDALSGLAIACGCDPHGSGSIDALVEFMGAVKELAVEVVAAGWSA